MYVHVLIVCILTAFKLNVLKLNKYTEYMISDVILSAEKRQTSLNLLWDLQYECLLKRAKLVLKG